ncbi:MAG TPA: hypothetical protein VHC72_04795 [Bryobacteraceae bacterium]|nr:hypothetical protein [Bryobacteraceae bacterium]
MNVAQPAPLRIEGFAQFFKRYISVSSVVTASLPIPIAAAKLIPVYDVQQKFLGTYTSLFCFLLLAFVFYSRHNIARWMFGRQLNAGTSWLGGFFSILPLLLIIGSACLVFEYHSQLEASITEVQSSILLKGMPSDSASKILAETDMLDVSRSTTLAAMYIGMFLSAELAFILMALREYLQDLLHLSEESLILRASRGN